MKYIVPLLILLVAFSQLIIWKGKSYSKWKGGGFGMYTEPHPLSHRVAWLNASHDGRKEKIRIYPFDSQSRKSLKKLSLCEEKHYLKLQKEIRKLMCLPRESLEQEIIIELTHFLQTRLNPNESSISIFERYIDIESNNWTLRHIYGND